MAGIQATGLGSNLDVKGLVDQLMSVEKQPLTKLDQKEAAVQVKISAYGTFKGALSTLNGTLAALQNPASYTVNKTSVADSSVASVSASAGADLGTHTLEVTDLAVAHRVKSGTYQSVNDVIGSGTLTIQYGTFDSTGNKFTVNAARATDNIKIDTTNNTLSGVRDAINAANAGVNASIVNDGTGYRLVVTSKNTGTENSLRISVADDDGNNTDTSGLSALAYDPTLAVGSGQNLSQVTDPKDAKFVLDGISITKAGNTVTDALSGTTINLLKTNAGSPTTFTVAKDTSALRTAVDAFVSAYNDLNTTVDKLTGYDATTKKGGDLSGDAAVRSVYGQLRDALSTVVSNAPDGYRALSQIGITLTRDGALSVDGSKLDAALSKDPQAVQGLFATTGYASDSQVNYLKSGSTTTAGVYALNVTQLATQGQAVGSTTAPLTIDSSNDSLTLKVDGVSTTVTLEHSTYASTAALAAELQSKINGTSELSSAGLKVSVADNAGVLSVTSASYGAASTVELTSGSALSALFGTPTSTAGVDVAGTFGSGQATGFGQQLTSSNGLGISVTGGATGDRGTVTFTRGIAVALDQLISQVNGGTGTLSSRITSLQGDVKDIDNQRDFINRELDVKQQRYLDQFNSLDGMISSMQSTMSYLAQQLASLNNNK